MDIDLTPFDQCAKDAMSAFKQTAVTGGLVPSVSHGIATTSYVQGAIFDVVSQFFNAKTADPVKAADKLARAIKAAM
ncbi:ABC-type sugar transport system periplasmic component [Photobacterium aphoticum]|uniref:ABC-type sugar transport system periplasmic component n=1 Tax=Photobacterium aphoticum TaxID=754436 RepID=A0A090R9K5_9GAMM|nr:ABC-type sugar transport system periplasmic component [Photobacterium aphoticum]